MGRRLRAFAVAVTLTTTSAAASHAQSGVIVPDARIARVGQWLKATALHEPGTDDEWATLVGSWTSAEVGTLWIDVNVLVQVMRNPSAGGFNARPDGRSRAPAILYTPSQLHRIRVLACAAAGTLESVRCAQLKATNELDDQLRHIGELVTSSREVDGDNFVLRRGALLHADIAMLVSPPPEEIGTSVGLGPQRISVQTSDGMAIGMGQMATHWEIGRMLLDHVRPRGASRDDPGHDEMVRRWYRATAAWMQNTEKHDTVHLDHAREIFPADPDILFLSATQHETYAGASIQGAMRSAQVATGWKFDVASAGPELRQAETLFRRAVAANPNVAETHLRYGRVLSLLEHYADAARELRLALDTMEDREQRYYGELFLGAAETGRRNFDAARDAYRRAEELFPKAQSPHIALSELARRLGDRGAALREMQPVFDLEAFEIGRDDPWWHYYVIQARNADALLEELRMPFRSEGAR